MKKLLYWLIVTVYLPRIIMLDLTQTPREALDLFITNSEDKVFYYENFPEPADVLDYPCLDQDVAQ